MGHAVYVVLSFTPRADRVLGAVVAVPPDPFVPSQRATPRTPTSRPGLHRLHITYSLEGSFRMTRCRSSPAVAAAVVGSQQVIAEVRFRVAHHSVYVVGTVLGVVQLHQEPLAGQPVVMADAWLERARPCEP
jgi:hypothetical protein